MEIALLHRRGDGLWLALQQIHLPLLVGGEREGVKEI
jgi:hypothetical protein